MSLLVERLVREDLRRGGGRHSSCLVSSVLSGIDSGTWQRRKR